MWRRYGDDLYALLVLTIFSSEALVLGYLTWRFAAGASDALGGDALATVLVFSVAATALALITIGSYVLAYHVISTRSERGRRERVEAWTARWVGVLFEEREPPVGPLPSEGVETLLNLREHLAGAEGKRVEALVRSYEIGEVLIDRSQLESGWSSRLRGLGSFRRRRLSRRLDALEHLAKARLSQSVEPLLRLLDDREPAIRLMALRSVARSLARMPEGPLRDRGILGFSEAVRTAAIPPGAVEECLLLLESAAPPVLAILLAASHDPPLLARVIDAVGRLKLLELGEQVAVHLEHPEAEVRAAALRTLGRLGYLPASAEASAAAALEDPTEFVRVQASRTAMLLPREVARSALWERLGDESWWVRRAAAQTLMGLGAEGPRLLQGAGTGHPDRFARHMAVQVLLDSGRLDPDLARSIQGAS
jgi:HEAT repeat protein